jgi:flagellar basal-body rod modification protein FlgD
MTIDPTSLRSAAAKIAQSLAPNRTPKASAAASSSSTSAAASSGAVISSNDFLSLLVTEMKNQDPTQPTDPNAYIQQLVGVNSLQQLISINQELTPPASATSSPVTTPAAHVSAA